MTNETSRQTSSSSGPTIFQAFIWGFMVAAFGSLFAFIGSLISDKPVLPPAADTLHGASTPAEMNRVVDTLLSVGNLAIEHDSALVLKLGFTIIALCVLTVIATVWIVTHRRQLQRALVPTWHTVLLILMLAVPPIIITVGACFMKGSLFQSSEISHALQNENTRPPVVRKGAMVTVLIPTTLQSFFAYHKCDSFKIEHAMAALPSGERIPVTLADARFNDGGRKPGSTDFIPLMENVKLRLQFTLPDDPELYGAVIDLGVSGSLNLIPSSSKEPTDRENFDMTARFRVARDQEADFQEDYDALTSRVTRYNWFSFPSAGFAILGIIFFSPWMCRKCRGRVSAFKIREDHLCPKCFEERQKAAEVKKKTAAKKIFSAPATDDPKKQAAQNEASKLSCPNGHGPLRLWDGKLKCWTCGWES
ncbi:MAG: hypothetical protein K8S27_04720 [Candidatus Omnitrophica bacterium]|nr:hypothetical protein [Candidatus Omnitrophota bacterium]